VRVNCTNIQHITHHRVLHFKGPLRECRLDGRFRATRARGKWRDFRPRAAARHPQYARVHTEVVLQTKIYLKKIFFFRNPGRVFRAGSFFFVRFVVVLSMLGFVFPCYCAPLGPFVCVLIVTSWGDSVAAYPNKTKQTRN